VETFKQYFESREDDIIMDLSRDIGNICWDLSSMSTEESREGAWNKIINYLHELENSLKAETIQGLLDNKNSQSARTYLAMLRSSGAESGFMQYYNYLNLDISTNKPLFRLRCPVEETGSGVLAQIYENESRDLEGDEVQIVIPFNASMIFARHMGVEQYYQNHQLKHEDLDFDNLHVNAKKGNVFMELLKIPIGSRDQFNKELQAMISKLELKIDNKKLTILNDFENYKRVLDLYEEHANTAGGL
jgi:hypothetical protein